MNAGRRPPAVPGLDKRQYKALCDGLAFTADKRTRDIGEDRLAIGSPAEDIGPTRWVGLPDGSPAYPWRRHFHRGYPEDVVAGWLAELERRGGRQEGRREPPR